MPCFPFGYMMARAHRIRIAAPATRASENLAHLLTGYPAAKFIYFGGSRRYPEVVDRLEEAVERYADTDPIAVRHIQYALGRDAARKFKNVEVKKGRRVVVAADPDLRKAVKHLDAARAPVKERDEPAFDPLTLSERRAAPRDLPCGAGAAGEGGDRPRETAKELKGRSAPAPAVDRVTATLATIRRQTRSSSRRKR